jgi:hypothetical protein
VEDLTALTKTLAENRRQVWACSGGGDWACGDGRTGHAAAASSGCAAAPVVLGVRGGAGGSGGFRV